MVGTASFALGSGAVVRADAPIKVTLCHRDANSNQPYGPKPIEVSINSVADAEAVSGHGDHTGPVFPAEGPDGKWGDIIEPFTYGDFSYPGMNWDAAGQAIFNNGCAIPPPPPTKKNVNVSTVVFDAATDKALVDLKLAAGGSVYDTSRVVAPSAIPAPTGTVTYIFYSTGNCVSPNALGTDHSTVALSGGNVPNSKTEPDLSAGSYSFKAIYSGDSHYNGNTSACEPFTVTPAPTKKNVNVSTVVFDAATDKALVDLKLAAGGSVYDTSRVVAPSAIPAPTGTVTYIFYSTGNCVSPNALGTDHSTVALSGGNVPNSKTEPDLSAGSYSFKAIYSGDPNYNGKASDCEPFTVTAAPSKAGTAVTTQSSETGSDVEPGASVTDTATVTNTTGSATPTGTVQFKLTFNGGPATNVGAPKTLDGTGKATSDAISGATDTAYGTYCWQAFYTATGNFKDSSGTDETNECFTVGGPYDHSTTTSTVVFNAATNAALVGNLPVNGSVYDTATVNHAGAGDPQGTISYTFYNNSSCSGDGTSAGSGLALGTKSSTKGPLAAGQYSFKAAFTSSDTEYFTSSISDCEPFTVAPAQINPTPSPTGGVEAATATATGGVLAATGASTPDQSFGLFLIALGLIAMMGGAFAWRRREA